MRKGVIERLPVAATDRKLVPLNSWDLVRLPFVWTTHSSATLMCAYVREHWTEMREGLGETTLDLHDSSHE